MYIETRIIERNFCKFNTRNYRTRNYRTELVNVRNMGENTIMEHKQELLYRTTKKLGVS